MLFGLGRCLRRTCFYALVIFLVLTLLKQNAPSVRQEINRWILGAKESTVVQAVSSLAQELSLGEGVKNAVEVFCDQLELDEEN